VAASFKEYLTTRPARTLFKEVPHHHQGGTTHDPPAGQQPELQGPQWTQDSNASYVSPLPGICGLCMFTCYAVTDRLGNRSTVGGERTIGLFLIFLVYVV
jgi:hypothetical protein